MSARRWTAGFATLAVLLGAVVAAVLATQVHQHFGEWRLWPSSTPPKLLFGGREYRRGTTVPAIPPGELPLDHLAGGELYGPGGATPTVVELKTTDGVTQYSLAPGR
jgi:hypothetical protein